MDKELVEKAFSMLSEIEKTSLELCETISKLSVCDKEMDSEVCEKIRSALKASEKCLEASNAGHCHLYELMGLIRKA